MKTIVSIGSAHRVVPALLLAASGCSNLAKPGPQSIQGMNSVGTVRMTEIIAAGGAAGKGNLDFQGQSYPFQLGG